MTRDQMIRIEQALRASIPTEALRTYALKLSAEGLGRNAIYDLFRQVFDKLEADGREKDQGHIELILDCITKFMAPGNPLYLDLPE